MRISYQQTIRYSRYKKDLWDILCACNHEFIPPLSHRNSTTQRELNLSSSSQSAKPTAYWKLMVRQQFLLALDGNKLIGFMSFVPKYDFGFGKSLYITTACVRNEYRNMGILNALYEFMEEVVAKINGISLIGLRTWSTNEPHIHVLEKRGYARLKTLRDDRGVGIDTIYFGKENK